MQGADSCEQEPVALALVLEVVPAPRPETNPQQRKTLVIPTNGRNLLFPDHVVKDRVERALLPCDRL